MLENKANENQMKAVIAAENGSFTLFIYNAEGECTDEFSHESLDNAIAHAEDEFDFSPNGWADQG